MTYTNIQVAVAALGNLAPKPSSKRFKALESVCAKLAEPFPLSGLVALHVHAELLALGWDESRAVDVLALTARLLDDHGATPPALVRFDGQRLTAINEGEPVAAGGAIVVIRLAHTIALVKARIDGLTSPARNAALN